ncbi:LPS export ABC transporter periplasmic protein LptC [Rhizobium sp. SSA_523]|uniref:LPS export ABC transporter periplasmic protein LptC n=1 Tax=Rhizobium sp. SSA_523 TaxID=2952477 RepID=UPI002091DD4A|nr:LPS export ABC transporter periplasmic protein LptC [Rhizobium sp. SSA_523]MCO5732655.1 LPS export ABC transporter periplasmic protein LptC [Rhizobium sp. SSA_523]WKC23715.1 LPS export ABC transporter periplasmic protein LptC [Rhizobium sp. SSA_523]
MLQRIGDISQAAQAVGGRADAYQAALAHSRRVRRLRIALPIAALVISAAFIGVSFVRAYLPENLSVQSATIEDGKIVMESPAMAGRNDKGMSYSMTATRALQDLENPNMITLENVKAAMPLNEDVIARVSAAGGIFDRSADRLEMTQPFTVNLSNGITAKFETAQLDVPQSMMKTDDPVEITTNEASIVANSMKISDNGKTLLFAGQVRVVLERSAPPQQGNQSATP